MLDKTGQVSEEMLTALQTSAQSIDRREQCEFINWLTDRQFACLGQLLLSVNDKGELKVKQRLGLFDLDDEASCWQPEDVFAERLMEHDFSNKPLLIYKGSRRSPVIRNEHVDVIMLPILDSDGELDSVLCTCLLYTSPSPRD